MPTLTCSIADAGKGNHDNQNAVQFFRKEQTTLKHEPADDITDGVGGHKDNTRGKHN